MSIQKAVNINNGQLSSLYKDNFTSVSTAQQYICNTNI